MNTRAKKLEDDLLVTHLPRNEKLPDGGGETGSQPIPASGDRAELRRRLLSAENPQERNLIISTIQDTLGNDIAAEIIQEARLANQSPAPNSEEENQE